MLPASDANLSWDASETGSSGTGDSMYGSWVAGLFLIGDSWQTPEVGLVVCDSVIQWRCSSFANLSVERQVNAISSTQQW